MPWEEGLESIDTEAELCGPVSQPARHPCCIKGLLAEMGRSLTLVIRATKIPVSAQSYDGGTGLWFMLCGVQYTRTSDEQPYT